jgi:Raf kinase inhibitor-like YbhB/YbcL family protein
MNLEISSPAFAAGRTLPERYTADGEDLSPPIRWVNEPGGTRSLALVCEDPDAPHGRWVHWVLFNLPAQMNSLEEGVPREESLEIGAREARQGKNDFGKIGYNGPAPPPGRPHRYYFKLYALDVVLNLPGGINQDELAAALDGHVLSEAALIAKYGR